MTSCVIYVAVQSLFSFKAITSLNTHRRFIQQLSSYFILTSFCYVVVVSSSQGTVTGPKRMAWSCVRGRSGGGQGKILPQRALGTEQTAQGSGHSPELPELKELSDIGFGFGGAVWGQELDTDDPCGSLPTQVIL